MGKRLGRGVKIFPRAAVVYDRQLKMSASKPLFPPLRLCVHVFGGVTLQRFSQLIAPEAPTALVPSIFAAIPIVYYCICKQYYRW